APESLGLVTVKVMAVAVDTVEQRHSAAKNTRFMGPCYVGMRLTGKCKSLTNASLRTGRDSDFFALKQASWCARRWTWRLISEERQPRPAAFLPFDWTLAV